MVGCLVVLSTCGKGKTDVVSPSEVHGQAEPVQPETLAELPPQESGVKNKSGELDNEAAEVAVSINNCLRREQDEDRRNLEVVFGDDDSLRILVANNYGLVAQPRHGFFHRAFWREKLLKLYNGISVDAKVSVGSKIRFSSERRMLEASGMPLGILKHAHAWIEAERMYFCTDAGLEKEKNITRKWPTELLDNEGERLIEIVRLMEDGANGLSNLPSGCIVPRAAIKSIKRSASNFKKLLSHVEMQGFYRADLSENTRKQVIYEYEHSEAPKLTVPMARYLILGLSQLVEWAYREQRDRNPCAIREKGRRQFDS